VSPAPLETHRAGADAGAVTPEVLLARFGLPSFRPGQREAVEAALAGRDSLVVMPTGGGKSLCYQLPALAGERVGLVLVVSPLIALMSDQLRRLKDAGVAAAMLASGMGEGHNEACLREIEAGSVQLVLAAPERFASGAFRRALAARRVGLFVVDEAHCVAEWGHDFRPDYLRLGGAIDALGRPAVMAATATATPAVAEEIVARLGLRDPLQVRSGFDRPNLVFEVATVEGKGAQARKLAALVHVLSGADARPAIVYCGTRRDTERIAQELESAGFGTAAYHAGMSPEHRRASQEAFMSGRAEVVVATNAFGMGVDKADVRTVAHWALPTSLEAYYQEAGRGGRDGRPARALLLASRSDLGRLIRFIKERETTVADVRAYVARLRALAGAGAPEPGSPQPEQLSIGHGELGERERVLLSIAERAGAAELEPGGAAGLLVTLTGRGSPRLAARAIAAARNRAWESYRSIERYSGEAERCRRLQILAHFGDPAAPAASGRCCDVCDPDPELAAAIARAPGAGRRRGAPGARLPSAASGGPAASPAIEVPEEQFEALRVWRMGRAEGKPAFTVASDATLRELIHRRPADLDELIGVRGIGPSFCERHGESALAALAALA
jgi:RecQ family ATP-dependent DNA helicase